METSLKIVTKLKSESKCSEENLFIYLFISKFGLIFQKK
jgi:hypothetical protein